jgi:Ferritin-like
MRTPTITTIPELRSALQSAIELEHSTIPPYLTALYSIKDGYNQEVAALITSVVMEEMLHMILACNLLNAIGGEPQINKADFVPRYPGPLPGGVRPGLVVSLRRCSIAQVRDVFMQIEEPDQAVGSHRENDHTIGDFYADIRAAFVTLAGRGDLFSGDPARQLGAAYWHGPGRLYEVTDLKSALLAIREIIRQGEGASAKNPEDGDDELAHFYKFEEIVRGRRMVRAHGGWDFTGEPVRFDELGVWPMAENPCTQNLTPGSIARRWSEEFDQSYTYLLNALHDTVNGHPDRMKAAIGLMFNLKIKAQRLVQAAINSTDNPNYGPNAGPSFQFDRAARE